MTVRSILLLLFVSCMARAQSAGVFEHAEYDFGKVKEDNGPVSHEFVFQNKGTRPISIVDVNSSCGCTTPEWSSTPVAPGSTGKVKAIFNPTNRPNAFLKTMQVVFDNDEKAELTIKGVVIPKIKVAKDEFYDRQGALAVKSRYLNVGTMYTNGVYAYEFEVHNTSDKIIKTLSVKAPAHMQVKIEPQKIPAGSLAKMTVLYDAKAKNDLGNFTEIIECTTDDADTPVKKFYFISTVLEYFPALTEEEIAKAPKIIFNDREFDFGRIKESAAPEVKVQITNMGASPLIIRKILPSCSCTHYAMDKKTIAPGATALMTVKFDAKDKEGKQLKMITVYSNDPSNSVTVLKFKAFVEN